MPPKSTKSKNKRPLEEGDDNQRQRRAKNAKTKEIRADQPAEERGESTQTGPRTRHIPRGPKGEAFMPQFMPRECADAKVIDKIPMPSRWVAAIDATPDRSMTFNSRQWWENHGPWLEAHKKQLKLSAANWKMKDEAMKQDASVPDDEGADDWDFVCQLEPNAERRRRQDDDEDDDEFDSEADSEDEDEKEGVDNDKKKDKGKGEEPEGREKKPYGKLASLHPEWRWFFTMRGEDRGQWWQQEALKRDQDDFSMHIYNDWTWYGMLELMDNIFQQFTDVLKPKASYRDIWPEVEGLALVLRSDLVEFAMCDDPAKCNKVIEMTGYLTLAAINALKKHNVFKPDSDIRNLGLVLAMLIKWGREQLDYGMNEESSSWIYKVIDLAEEAGVELTGPYKFEDDLEGILDERDRKAKGMKRWDSVNWASKVKTYTSKHVGVSGAGQKPKLAGHTYDITKMRAAERKRYSLGSGGGLSIF